MSLNETLTLVVTKMHGGVCVAGVTAEPDPVTGLRWLRPIRESGHALLGDITTTQGHVLSLSRALKGTSKSPLHTDRFPLFGALPNSTLKSIRASIDGLEQRDLLEPFEKGRYRLLRLTAQGQTWLDANPKAPEPIPFGPEAEARSPTPRTQGPSVDDQTTDYDEALFERLRAWRWEKAKELDCAPYVIFHNAVLRRIAAVRPDSLDELAAIKGIGPRKLEQSGAQVLAVLLENPQS